MSKKVQLNILVDEAIDEAFRKLAAEAGYGKKPAPLLEVLLAIYSPSLPRLYARMDRVFREKRELTAEERFYAAQLRDLFGSLLEP